MSAFKTCTLGDVLTLQRGYDLPTSARLPGVVPVVSSSGVTGSHSEAKVRGPGVVIGRYGTLGEVYFVQPDFWPLNTALYVKDFKGNDPRFCAYLLKTVAVVSTSGAAAVPGVNRNVLHQLSIRCPPLGVQQRIASILGAYDDLIDVNRGRIALLEEMARRLFDEWFVRSHQAGHQWKRGIAADLIDFDPRTPLGDGPHHFVPMTALDTSTSLVDTQERRDGNAGAKFRNGDTLFARITPCLENGKTGLVRGLPGAGVGFGSTEFIVMRGARAGAAFTYCLARHGPFRSHAQRSMTGASGRQRARLASVRGFELAIPPKELLERFEDLAWPMFEMVGNLGRSSAVLSAIRSLVLPRLISGEVSVTTAEQELEAAA